MPFDTIVTDIPIPADGQYAWYTVRGDQRVRPITIGGNIPLGAFNLDAFLLFQGSVSKVGFFDSALNRGTPYQIDLGHLNGWANPGDQLHFQITNWTVAGNVFVYMWFEYVNRADKGNQKVTIGEQPIKTDPLGGLKKLIGY